MKRYSRTKKTNKGQTRVVIVNSRLRLANTPAAKEGTQPTNRPLAKSSLLEFLDTLEPLDEDFPEIEDLPPEPVDF